MARSVFTGMLAAVVVTLVGPIGSAEGPHESADQVLERMSAKAESVKDMQASCKVTKFDSVFEEKRELRLELAHKKPHLARVDTYRKVQGVERHTQQVIVGEDFVLRVWPENRHGERRRLTPEETQRRREDRNDPLSFFSRKPDDLRKDFVVKLLDPEKPGRARLLITPRNEQVPFDYDSVELSVDTKTWIPAAIKATREDDWSLYEFDKVRVNVGLGASAFEPMKGIRIEEAEGPEPPGKDEE